MADGALEFPQSPGAAQLQKPRPMVIKVLLLHDVATLQDDGGRNLGVRFFSGLAADSRPDAHVA